jgi:hypothetical protein
MSSTCFSVQLLNGSINLSYLNQNLKINQSYESIKDLGFLQTFTLKEHYPSNLKCNCVNGKAKIRIGILNKTFSDFNSQEIEKSSKFESFAFDIFDTLAETLNIK